MREEKFQWTDDKVEILMRGLAKGDTYVKIGSRLGITKYAVSGKVERMHLRQRRLVTSGDYIGKRITKRQSALLRDARAEEQERIRIMRNADLSAPTIRRTSIEPCSYVLELRPTTIYCDVPSEPGKSMCKEHCELCYRPASESHHRLSSA
jgi:hypothetical protein